MSNIKKVFGAVRATDTAAAARESTQMFIRGKTQLALLDEGSLPPGHIMTAWEAYQSYGFEILDEAAEYGSAILLDSVGAIEKSLSVRRKELGLSVESVAGAARVNPDDVRQSEIRARDIPVQTLEKMCLALGLDERLLAFDRTAGADHDLAFRLKALQQAEAPDTGLSAGTVLTFAEAASIIRIQSMLQDWLGNYGAVEGFHPSDDYGSSQNPAWHLGYGLASQTRMSFDLEQNPIPSMRDLVEGRLNIPVVQARLHPSIAGATIETRAYNGGEVRGFVLNTIGENENVWVRRATLAHELGHLLYDPGQKLNRLRVDPYTGTQADPESGYHADFVEQRANAFAIAFLAPLDSVREMAPPPITAEAVGNVMQTFGISQTAARYHVSNAHYRQYTLQGQGHNLIPSEDWRIAEDFALDYFPIASTPPQRRGRFAGLVAECHERRLLSSQTAAFYLGCEEQEFLDEAGAIRSLYPI